jgi:hypothetical protein
MQQKTDEKSVTILIIPVICLFLYLLVRTTWFVQIDAAEFENLQASWLVSQGFVPYLQFFNHHTPFFFYLVAPFFPLFGQIQTDPTVAIQSISILRMGMVFLTLLIAVCVFAIARTWRGQKIAWISVFLYLSIDMVARKAIETRPNLLATLLVMIAFFLLIRSYQAESHRKLQLFLSGLFYSLAVLVAEETFLFGIWFVLILVTDLVFGNTGEKQSRLGEISLVVGGFLTGMIWFLVYLLLNHSAHQFFRLVLSPDNFRVSPIKKILQFVAENPLHFIFMGSSLFAGIRSFQTWKQHRTERAIFIFGIGMMMSVLLTQEPHGQYFFFMFPAFAILAGDGANKSVLYVMNWLSKRSKIQRTASVLFLEIILILSLCWQFFLGGAPTDGLKAALIVCCVGCLLISIHMILQKKEIALHWLILVLLLIGSVRSLGRVNQNLLAQQASIKAIKYVIANSDPTDTVLDGRSGTGLYRPIAWYYWVQHTQIGEEISPVEVNSLLDLLQDGSIHPEFVCLDRFLHRYPTLVEYVEQHYQPIGVGDLWQITTE